MNESIKDALSNQKQRILSDLVTDVQQIIGTDNPNFGLLIDDQLQVELVGSLVHGVQYSQGAAKSLVFSDKDVTLDVLVAHPDYMVPSQLKQKVFQLLKLKNKEIRLQNSKEAENTHFMYLGNKRHDCLFVVDYERQIKYNIRLIFC